MTLNPINQPWNLLGDFNNIVDLSEKLGGCQSTTVFMNKFINFLNNGNLISLMASGVPYTWCNGHNDNTRTYERLDRGVANSLWLNEFPDYSLHNYPIFGSDHSPILLSNDLESYRMNNTSLNLRPCGFNIQILRSL